MNHTVHERKIFNHIKQLTMEQQRTKQIHSTLAFLRSVILSGEPMTDAVRDTINESIENVSSIEADLNKEHSFAFPLMNELGNVHQQGMTELTYIATKAMQGILSHPDTALCDDADDESVAHDAYRLAKAMLNEQKKHE